MAHMGKGINPIGSYNKLEDKKLDPFRITHKVRSNIYVLALPSDLQTSPTSNVEDLFEYHPPNDGHVVIEDEKARLLQERGNDREAYCYVILIPIMCRLFSYLLALFSILFRVFYVSH